MSFDDERDAAVAVLELLAGGLGYTLTPVKAEPKFDPLADLRSTLEVLPLDDLIRQYHAYQDECARFDAVRREWCDAYDNERVRLKLTDLPHADNARAFPLALDAAGAETRRAEAMRILTRRIARQALDSITAEPTPAEPEKPTAA